MPAPCRLWNSLAGFAAGDVVELKNLHPTKLSFLDGILTRSAATTVLDIIKFDGT